MTIREKRQVLYNYCVTSKCNGCRLRDSEDCLNIGLVSEAELDKALAIIGYNGEKTDDPVNRPSHYTDGKIEVIEFIEDKKLGFCLGNAVKYIARAGKKDPTKEVEDLKKARWYIDRRIKEIEEFKT
jgi:hypothetical protein